MQVLSGDKAGFESVPARAPVMNEDGSFGINDQVMLQRRALEIALQLDAVIIALCAGRENLDNDHRIGHLQRIAVHPVAAIDQHIGLKCGLFVNAHQGTVDRHVADKTGFLDGFVERQPHGRFGFPVSGPFRLLLIDRAMAQNDPAVMQLEPSGFFWLFCSPAQKFLDIQFVFWQCGHAGIINLLRLADNSFNGIEEKGLCC